MKIYLLSTYPPTKCGIAEYSSELAETLRSKGVDVGVIAVEEDSARRIAYPREVEFIVEKEDPRSYRRAADYVEDSGADAVCIQHEYGIFGGRWGSHLLEFMRKLSVPIVTTLHTVLPEPEPWVKTVTDSILEASDAVTVMSRYSHRILRRYYRVDGVRVYTVPHGVKTPVLNVDGRLMKARFGFSRYFLMLTIGLIGPNKGIEYAIEALPKIARHIPNVKYLVVGETHPKIKSVYGESYRRSLVKLARRLGVEDKVVFIDRFLSKCDYVDYILASDVVVLPYLDRRQVSSGALSYALGCGRAVVATPFVYAEEALSDGRGVLCRFRDSESIAEAVVKLARDPEFKAEIERKAYIYGLRLRWENVGTQLLSVISLASVGRILGGRAYAASAYA